MIVCVWKSWSSDLGYPTIVVFACALEIPLHFEISVFQEKEGIPSNVELLRFLW